MSESSNSVRAAMAQQGVALQEILASMDRATQSVDQTNAVANGVSEDAKKAKDMASVLAITAQNLAGNSREVAGDLEIFLSNVKRH